MDLMFFLSSKFHNHSHRYNQYVLVNGNISLCDENGEVLEFTVFDFSITKTVVGTLISLILMVFLTIRFSRLYAKDYYNVPKGLYSVMEIIVIFVRDSIAKPSIGENYNKFMPYLLSVFLFILVSNVIGLVPFIGGFNIMGNISVTLTLALFTFLITNLSGRKSYWKHIFLPSGIPSWLLPIMIPIEVLGIFIKPIVLMLRLFANITAGHIIILSFISLIFIVKSIYGDSIAYLASPVSLFFSMFINVIEILVSFLQAYVFTLLSAIYFGLSTNDH